MRGESAHDIPVNHDATLGGICTSQAGAGRHGLRKVPSHLVPARRKSTGAPTKKAQSADTSHGEGFRRIAQNRRARHEYDILETFEAGLELKGAEVKSLRAGQVSLQDSYARVEDGEIWLVGARIAPYEYASGFGAVPADRARKLLLHRRQIDELKGRVAQQALTLVPLSIYFSHGRAKVEIALARGRRLYDKRRALADRDAAREAERAMKGAY